MENISRTKAEDNYLHTLMRHPALGVRLNRFADAIDGLPVRSVLLTGGIPLGEYTPQVSDIDIVVVVEGRLPGCGTGLRRLLSEFSNTGIEILLLETDELGKEAPVAVRSLEPLGMYGLHAFDLILLRQYSIVLYGDDCRNLIRELFAKDEIAGILHHVFNHMVPQTLTELPDLHPRISENDLIIATGCVLARCLYTLFHFDLASKPEALRWGIVRFGDEPGCSPLAGLFRWLLAWRNIEERKTLNNEELVFLFRQSIPIYRDIVIRRLKECPVPSGEALLKLLNSENTGGSALIPVFSSSIFSL